MMPTTVCSAPSRRTVEPTTSGRAPNCRVRLALVRRKGPPHHGANSPRAQEVRRDAEAVDPKGFFVAGEDPLSPLPRGEFGEALAVVAIRQVFPGREPAHLDTEALVGGP
jgi:hypothetical protein